MSELLCPICGKPTRVYMGNARKDRLCAYHAEQLKKGEVSIDENNLFVDKNGVIINKDYDCSKKIKENKNDNKKDDNDERLITKCIACGKETKNGNLFCIQCYHKYKDKKLLVKIVKCKEIEIMDESYEGMFKCRDGHIVKSKSEREIDNYLFEKGIAHAYEKSISIDEDKNHDIHPDFCLPNFKKSGKNVYIEHWGFNSNNIEYTKSKNYKLKQYKKLGLTVISTTEKDMNDPEAALDRKLEHFKYDIVNFADEE